MHSPASDVPGQKPFWMSTSSSSGPLASFDRSAGSIRFVSGEVLVLLRPTESFHHHGSIEEAPWPVVRGAVELDLPKAKRIELLEVELVSKYELKPPWGKTETGVLFSKKQVIDTSQSKLYPAGTHHFVFEFPVDPNTAPYDNCEYGQVTQRVYARAPGIGAFGSDATAKLAMAFLVTPAPLGEMPPSLEWRHQAYSSELGPYSLDIASDALIVAALVNFRFRFHDPPFKVRIHGIVLSVEQTVHLQVGNGAYKQAGQPVELLAFAWDGGRTTAERTDDGTLVGRHDPLRPFEARSAHTCTLKPGEPREFANLGQLPTDNWLRPSTFAGTKTPIKMSHVLVVSVYYRDPFSKKDLRQMKIQRPVEIASCTSISNNLILPEYGAEPDSEVLKAKANVSQFQFDCAYTDSPIMHVRLTGGMTLSSMVSQAQKSGLARYWDEPDRSEQPVAPKSDQGSRSSSLSRANS